MKYTIASALPALALLPGVLAAGLDKRGVCTRTNTVRVRHTVTVNPTVTHNARTDTTTITSSITVTRTGATTTKTVTDPTTSTISASAGFVAAASAIPQSESKRNAKFFLGKREAEAEAKVNKKDSCGRYTTKTVKQTVKPYNTKYGPAVTVNVGKPKTKIVSKTVATTTTHPVVTVQKAKATHYAACEASNLLGYTIGSVSSNSTGSSNGTASGHVGINSVLLAAGTSPKSSDSATAQQCCIKCQTTTGCVGSQWRAGVCNLHVSTSASTCSADAQTQNFGTFYANPNNYLDAGEGLILSNGRCGTAWRYGGLTS